jgi:acetolactate synthase-1/2/3 large subunit
LKMNGAESLVATARACGIDVCFANPGTTEMPLVTALDKIGGIRAILGLFEGVCTGAADGYGRMAERPAMTLLHLGPGFANGIANLHNARRARSPLVNVVGDHATWHRAADAPLTSDIISLAKPVSAWLRTVNSPESAALDMAAAIGAAARFPGHVATLIVPADCQWGPAKGAAGAQTSAEPAPVQAQVVEQAASVLRGAKDCALFLGGQALRARGLRAAARIAAGRACALFCETFPARVERGPDFPALIRLPYFPEQAIEALSPYQAIVIAGAPAPVAFFGYPNTPSYLIPQGREVAVLARPEQDVAAALEALADALDAPGAARASANIARPDPPRGALTAAAAGQAIAALAPDNAIVVDEAATSGLSFFANACGAFTHTYLALTGGAIGQGLPCATGAAVAWPQRKVISFQADGGGMYTLQALWTQARENLNVTTLICNNRSYRILQIELARAGIQEPGPSARALTELDRPALEWVHLARGMGVPGVRVESADALVEALKRALAESGPRLIEMMMQ